MSIIIVSKDFTCFPSGKSKVNNPYSGESFADNFIKPYLLKKQKVTIQLDGVIGYSSVFLKEAFGGSIRSTNISCEDFLSLINLESSNKILLKEIKTYLKECENK